MPKNKSLSPGPQPHTRPHQSGPEQVCSSRLAPETLYKGKRSEGRMRKTRAGSLHARLSLSSPLSEGSYLSPLCSRLENFSGTRTLGSIRLKTIVTLCSTDGRSPHPSISFTPRPAGTSRPAAALGAVPPALPGHPGGFRPFLTSSDLCSPEEGGEGDEHGHRRVPGPPFRFPSRGPSLHLHAGRPQA